jgi:hypothetical protein
VDASRVGLHVAMTFVAVTSAGAMGRSVREADAVSAYLWAAVYAGSSLLASECFVGLLRTLFLFFAYSSALVQPKREILVRMNAMKGGL